MEIKKVNKPFLAFKKERRKNWHARIMTELSTKLVKATKLKIEKLQGVS